MNYRIIRTVGSLVDLERLTQAACAEGWGPCGQPFSDSDRREWCQAVVKRSGDGAVDMTTHDASATPRVHSPAKPGDIKLREPRKP